MRQDVIRGLYYDIDGNEITSNKEWMEYYASMRESGAFRIKKENIKKGLIISTIWLGMNHSHIPGEPLIFETLVYLGDFKEIFRELYETQEEAIEGHKRIKQMILSGEIPIE